MASTAVATSSVPAAVRTEPLPQPSDSSPSRTSAAAEVSLLSSSPAAEVIDRSDSSNSSPNLFADAENQTMDALKSEEYRQLFRLPPDEVLIEDFNCALQENILIQGHMYLFVNFICFYSNIFGFETKRIIAFPEVTSVRRAKTAGLFPNAIEILAGNRKYFFASFLSRDEAFKIINDGWLRQANGTRAVIEQESMSECSGQDSELIATENVKSSDILDNDSPSADPSKVTTNIINDMGPPSNIIDSPVVMKVTDKQSSTKQVAEPVLNEDSPAASSCWKEEDIDAPTIPEEYTCVAEAEFPIKVEDFFRYFFSDDAVNFHESFHKRCGDKDFKCSLWRPQEKFGYARELSFQHPIKLYLGAKFGGCHELQKFRVYRSSHLVIETSQEVSDVPYADYFRVEGLWDIQRHKDDSCILRVYVTVAFSKKTIWRGKILQSTVEECREAYTTWISMAHDLLKQKNLEKQERGAVVASTQNGKINPDIELETVETSGASQEECNSTRIQATSSVADAIHKVDTQMQTRFIDTSSVPSLFKDYVRKLRLSLKSQNNLSLLIVAIFALIFFMQFSILVLLSRPQHIHVNPPIDNINMMENGVTRTSSDMAWLEKRIHHLKDEMYMVETRLERMRYEHALLKKQLNDLERK
ncbi:protein VASCULAR ASSOCIATED DEATH 1, chloroplastic isoform X2 [Arachis duranensis]|uniref:Protein VASCULAR ASSOCIATED DEATH 1, chloroplastic isoform X2 n=1 Tax=Arachis duranensis TaxID=130453 RepID=A0A6P4BFC2_ARADU|nr:protein VASCULAR ASSOCIATED DEATH 1, chloroplastic isoform X2 [Arachis duranensis]XP_025618187.1 protein VASCULAR ASSOCIATED DEATH 1, chloroplastic isoform X2 [Arachis hypogaea]